MGYAAWYQWFSDYAYTFDSLELGAGDEIRLTVEATSTTSGTTVENLTTSQIVSHNFDGGVQGELHEVNAEWIVEDFTLGGSAVALVNFGTVVFEVAQSIGLGAPVGPSGAWTVDLLQKNQILSSVYVTDDSVTVKYI